MTAKKSPSTPASKSTKLTDATKSKVSISNPEVTMKSDNSINSTIAINATTTINSDNAVNDTTPASADNLFGNKQTAIEAIPVTEPPKQQRVGKQQRKSDLADFKATYLMPSKLMKRHPVNIEDSVWAKLERIARILGDRDTTVGSHINAILVEHLDLYGDDTEIWRKL